MSRYSLEKPNWKKVTVWGIIIVLLVQIAVFAVGALWMTKSPHKIKLSTKLGTVVYSEEANSSSFSLNLNTSYNDFSYYTATEVAYKFIFKDVDGSVLSEQTIASPEDLTKNTMSFTFAFGTDTTPAIAGKVASVSVELANVNYVNRIAYEGGSVGMKYILENWYILLLLVASFVLLLAVAYLFETDSWLGFVFMMIVLLAGLVCLIKASTEIIVALYT